MQWFILYVILPSLGSTYIFKHPLDTCAVKTPKTAATSLLVSHQEPHEVQCAMAPTSITIDMFGVLEHSNL